MKTFVAVLALAAVCLAQDQKAKSFSSFQEPAGVKYESGSSSAKLGSAKPAARAAKSFAQYTPTPYYAYSQPSLKYVASAPAAAFHYSAPAPVHYSTPVTYSAPVAHYVQPAAKAAQPPVAILSQNSDFSYDGNFNYAFQAENGISSQASGTVRNFGTDDAAQVMSGSYTYTAPDGTPITTNWYADETGFHAEGAHIPQPPEEITRAVEYLKSLPPTKEYQQ